MVSFKDVEWVYRQSAFRRFYLNGRYILAGILVGVLMSFATAMASDKTDCDIQNGSCTKTYQDRDITLDIQPKPVKAMQDLTCRITIQGKQPASHPFIDLGMPGMKMGPNQVKLKPAGSGVYEGTGVIVRCPSGRTIWRAKITVPEVGEVSFTFDVIY